MKGLGRFCETRFEVREDDEGPLIVGHGAVFDTESVDLGGWREVIAPGAFTQSLRDHRDVLSCFNHSPHYVLGRTTARTLRVAEDLDGLVYEARPPDTQWARDLVVSLKRKDIRGSSFAFDAVKVEWGQSERDGAPLRTVVKARLYELGPVTFPAYPSADSGVRSLLDELGEEAGIDFRGLAGIMARRRDGVALAEGDHALVVAAIEALRGILPAAEPSGERSARNDSLDVLRRRLELVRHS